VLVLASVDTPMSEAEGGSESRKAVLPAIFAAMFFAKYSSRYFRQSLPFHNDAPMHSDGDWLHIVHFR